MKTLHITIISVIGIACTITASMAWYFLSYDPTPVTTENDFGINALVIHRPSMGCPVVENCIHPDYYLKIHSKSKTFITGYNICDVNSCVKQIGFSISLPLMDVLHPNYQELPLPDNLPWKDGDFVDIKVKAPSTLIMGITNSSIPTIWIDLGKSEIVRSS